MNWLKKGVPALVLAPMEGVTDFPMRALLTEIGGFTLCVSEFIRVSHEIPPAHVFFRHVPELKTKGVTASGVPVQIQILGGDPEKIAETALVAVGAGAKGIDINFGCPAATVNRHDGGATLLKYPDRIRKIVASVRRVVPAAYPVSAKLRLGFDDPTSIHQNADQVEAGGASWITIHGRTKVQAYLPPALWKPIGEVNRRLSIPVVANGDLWTYENFRRCQDETACDHFMIGRGALGNPYFAHDIANQIHPRVPMTIADWRPLLEKFAALSEDYYDKPGYTPRRIKQWIKMATLTRPIPWFDLIKRCETLEEMWEMLRVETSAAPLRLYEAERRVESQI